MTKIKTELFEIQNGSDETLRGLFVGGHTDSCTLMLHGMGRNTAELKFKKLADALAAENVSSLRVDFTGCGNSDGDFSTITTARMTDDTACIMAHLAKMGITKISVVTHSAASCAIAALMGRPQHELTPLFQCLVLLAPALTQSEWMRYFFIFLTMLKHNRPTTDLTFASYKEFFIESKFQEDCTQPRFIGPHLVSPAIFLENKEMDYAPLIDSRIPVLHIHGTKDEIVPIESFSGVTAETIKVIGGDHDLEHPDMLKQWLKPATQFLVNSLR